jgi:hypothetical protein
MLAPARPGRFPIRRLLAELGDHAVVDGLLVGEGRYAEEARSVTPSARAALPMATSAAAASARSLRPSRFTRNAPPEPEATSPKSRRSFGA